MCVILFDGVVKIVAFDGRFSLRARFQVSKKSELDLVGRTDGNIKVIFPRQPIPCASSSLATGVTPSPRDYVHVEVMPCGIDVVAMLHLEYAGLGWTKKRMLRDMRWDDLPTENQQFFHRIRKTQQK